METLFELTQEYLNLMNMACDPDIEPEIIEDTMEGLGGIIEVKAEGYAKVIRNLEEKIAVLDAHIETRNEEIKRYKAFKDVIENNITRMKKALYNAMVLTDKRKFETELFKFSIAKSAPSVVIDDASQIPDEYYAVKREVSKTLIKDAIKEGKEVAGAHMEQDEGVRIK